MKTLRQFDEATHCLLERCGTMDYRILVPIAGAALLLLGGCDREISHLLSEPLRAGADRQVAPAARLPQAQPPPSGYAAAVVPDNATRDASIGSAVAAAGGQRVQKEKEQKEIAGIKRRWAREQAGEPPEASSAGLPPAPQSAKVE